MARITHKLGTLFAIAIVAAGACAAFAPVPFAHVPAAHAETTAATPSATGAAATPATTGGTPSATSPTTGGGTQGLGAWVGDQFNKLFGWIFANIASLFALLLGVAALTLDNAVYYTIVHMGDFVRSVANIGVVWGILRDIGNIALIFGFLFAGIAIIVDANLFGFSSKMLPMLLVAAVFLNFSLFISQAIIDTGNLFATEIYAQINNGKIPSPYDSSTLGGSNTITNEGISNRIMSVLGLQSIYHPTNGKSIADQDTLKNSALMSFMAILLFVVATFVFFSLAFMVVARFVALIFIMILAPLGFAGLAIPKLEGLAKKWWGMLIEQTITAPVLMLLLYAALAVITDTRFIACAGLGNGACTEANNQGAASAWSGFLTGNLQYFGGIVLVFIIAMGLLLAVVIVAKQMSAFGGKWAIGLGSKLSGLTIAAAAPGAIGRNTFGLVGTTGGRWFRSTRAARIPILGRTISGGFDRAAKASFDVRPTGGSVKLGGLDLNLGKRQKGGAAESEKQAIKARETYAKDLTLNKTEEAEAKAARKSFNDWKDGLSDAQRKAQKKQIEEREKAVIELEKKAQIAYAGGLEWQPPEWRAWPVGKGRYVNKKAAENITKEARKKPSAKGLEGAIKAAVEENPEEFGITGGGGAAGAAEGGGAAGGGGAAAGGGEGGGAGGGGAAA